MYSCKLYRQVYFRKVLSRVIITHIINCSPYEGLSKILYQGSWPTDSREWLRKQTSLIRRRDKKSNAKLYTVTSSKLILLNELWAKALSFPETSLLQWNQVVQKTSILYISICQSSWSGKFKNPPSIYDEFKHAYSNKKDGYSLGCIW